MRHAIIRGGDRRPARPHGWVDIVREANFVHECVYEDRSVNMRLTAGQRYRRII